MLLVATLKITSLLYLKKITQTTKSQKKVSSVNIIGLSTTLSLKNSACFEQDGYRID